MPISASYPSEEHYLQLDGKGLQAPVDRLTVNFKNPFIENVLFDKVLPLFYKARVHLSLSVSEEFKGNFVLLKGLMEFHRSKHLNFEYDALRKLVQVDVEIDQLQSLQIFLQWISVSLWREIDFKKNLKTVMEFENRYKIASAEVYALIQKSVS